MSSGYRMLWLLVEGDDDERFCEAVLSPVFQARYDHVKIWQYSQQKSSKTVGLIRSIGSMNADYLLLGDIDERPCVTVTKEELATQFSVLSSDRVIVVRREIEAWYLAGLSEEARRELGLGRVTDAESVTKEQFDQLVGGRRRHTSTMEEILKHYDVEVARQRSPSFRYFLQKHVEQENKDTSSHAGH